VQSSAIVELTEAETEYAINVVKHIYPGHVVFQFNCTNTIAEQLLENVITFSTPPLDYFVQRQINILEHI
jgi:coatomer protein complex subunit gamma